MAVVLPGYELLTQIGQGGMGTVYRARQLSMDRVVAVKVLAQEHARDPQVTQRFLREARALAKLSSTHIVAAIDAFEHEGILYFVMEFVDGPPLSTILDPAKKLPERRAMEISLQVARALDHAHKHSIVHRDIKPHNILISREGTVKVCDFGLAKSLRPEDAGLTKSHQVAGTPQYVSPEQARGDKDIDIRSDIYSLGASMYRMVTGAPVFSGDNAMAVMVKHATQPAVPPKKICPELTDGANYIILKCLQKDRAQRYQNPAALIEDIDKLLHGIPVIPKSTFRRVTSPPRRSQWPLVVAAIVLIVTASVGVIIVTRPAPAQDQLKPTAKPTAQPKVAIRVDGAPQTREQADEEFRKLVESARGTESELTGPYENVTRRIHDDPEFTAHWEEIRSQFMKQAKERTRSEWEAMSRQVAAARSTGTYKEARDAISQFPKRFLTFDVNGKVSCWAQELAQLQADVQTRLDAAVAQDERKIKEALANNRFNDAWSIAEGMTQYFDTTQITPIRQHILTAEFAALFSDPPKTREVAAADKRAAQLRRSYPAEAALIELAARLVNEAREKCARAEESLRSKAEEATNRQAGTLEEALRQRKPAEARTILWDLIVSPEFQAIRSEADAKAVPWEILELWLTGQPIEGMTSKIEESMIELHLKAAPTALRSVLFWARTIALLEDLYKRALAGLLANDVEKLKSAATDALKTAKRVQRANEPLAIRVGSETLFLAPRQEPCVSPSDICLFAQTENKPDPYSALEAGAFCLFEGERRLALEYLSRVSEGRARLEIEWFIARAKKLPPKPTDVLKGRVRIDGDRWQVTYDFRNAEQLDDFESFGGVKANLAKNGVKVEGTGFWFLKVPLQGDVKIETDVTALSEGFGFAIHSDGTAGYCALANPDLKKLTNGRVNAEDRLILIRLPVKSLAHLDTKPGMGVKPNTRYRCVCTRERTNVTALVGSVRALGTDDVLNSGQSGLALLDHSVMVHSLTITGQADKDWVKRALEEASRK